MIASTINLTIFIIMIIIYFNELKNVSMFILNFNYIKDLSKIIMEQKCNNIYCEAETDRYKISQSSYELLQPNDIFNAKTYIILIFIISILVFLYYYNRLFAEGKIWDKINAKNEIMLRVYVYSLHFFLMAILIVIIVMRYVPYDDAGYLNYFKNNNLNSDFNNFIIISVGIIFIIVFTLINIQDFKQLIIAFCFIFSLTLLINLLNIVLSFRNNTKPILKTKELRWSLKNSLKNIMDKYEDIGNPSHLADTKNYIDKLHNSLGNGDEYSIAITRNNVSYIINILIAFNELINIHNKYNDSEIHKKTIDRLKTKIKQNYESFDKINKDIYKPTTHISDLSLIFDKEVRLPADYNSDEHKNNANSMNDEYIYTADISYDNPNLFYEKYWNIKEFGNSGMSASYLQDYSYYTPSFSNYIMSPNLYNIWILIIGFIISMVLIPIFFKWMDFNIADNDISYVISAETLQFLYHNLLPLITFCILIIYILIFISFNTSFNKYVIYKCLDSSYKRSLNKLNNIVTPYIRLYDNKKKTGNKNYLHHYIIANVFYSLLQGHIILVPTPDDTEKIKKSEGYDSIISASREIKKLYDLIKAFNIQTKYTTKDLRNKVFKNIQDIYSDDSSLIKFLDNALKKYAISTTVSFTGGGGSGATGTAVVSNGVIQTVSITTGGNGYTSAPTVSFTGEGGSGATGTAVVSNGVIQTVSITTGGTGYTSAPTVSFTGGGGSGATGTAVVSDGKIKTVIITTEGSGYTGAPNVSFTGGGGSGATGTAVVSNGVIQTVSITTEGSGYNNSSKILTNLYDIKEIIVSSNHSSIDVCKLTGLNTPDCTIKSKLNTMSASVIEQIDAEFKSLGTNIYIIRKLANDAYSKITSTIELANPTKITKASVGLTSSSTKDETDYISTFNLKVKNYKFANMNNNILNNDNIFKEYYKKLFSNIYKPYVSGKKQDLYEYLEKILEPQKEAITTASGLTTYLENNIYKDKNKNLKTIYNIIQRCIDLFDENQFNNNLSDYNNPKSKKDGINNYSAFQFYNKNSNKILPYQFILKLGSAYDVKQFISGNLNTMDESEVKLESLLTFDEDPYISMEPDVNNKNLQKIIAKFLLILCHINYNKYTYINATAETGVTVADKQKNIYERKTEYLYRLFSNTLYNDTYVINDTFVDITEKEKGSITSQLQTLYYNLTYIYNYLETKYVNISSNNNNNYLMNIIKSINKKINDDDKIFNDGSKDAQYIFANYMNKSKDFDNEEEILNIANNISTTSFGITYAVNMIFLLIYYYLVLKK